MNTILSQSAQRAQRSSVHETGGTPLFARVQRDRLAIERASNRLRMLGIPAAKANMSVIADDLYDDILSDLNS